MSFFMLSLSALAIDNQSIASALSLCCSYSVAAENLWLI